MSPELTTRLLSRAQNGNGHVTPKQIQEYLGKSEVCAHLGTIADEKIPSEVSQLLLNKKGRLDGEKLAKFRSAVERVADSYGIDTLTFLTPRCLRKDGSINLRRLGKIIAKY